MLDKARLDTDRQANVSNAVAAGLAAERTIPLLPGTVARGDALLAAMRDLSVFAGFGPGQVDRATDSVVTAFERAREEDEGALLDSVVPLGAAQLEALARVRLIRTQVFPQGTGFIRRRMDLELSLIHI